MSGAKTVAEGRASARPIIQEKAGRHHHIHLSPLEAHNRSIIIFVTCCSAKKLRRAVARALDALLEIARYSQYRQAER